MKLGKISDNILTARGGGSISLAGLQILVAAAYSHPSGRARVNLHEPTDRVQDMIIALTEKSIVIPHKHKDKSETFHIIAGRLMVMLYDDNGLVTEETELNEVSFYYRIFDPVFHSVRSLTPTCIFREVTEGPYDSANKEEATWRAY